MSETAPEETVVDPTLGTQEPIVEEAPVVEEASVVEAAPSSRMESISQQFRHITGLDAATVDEAVVESIVNPGE
jgi:hypothetical protein